jgi:hypothetical protein
MEEADYIPFNVDVSNDYAGAFAIEEPEMFANAV